MEITEEMLEGLKHEFIAEALADNPFRSWESHYRKAEERLADLCDEEIAEALASFGITC